MRFLTIGVVCLFIMNGAIAQNNLAPSRNIYTIRQQMQQYVLHNPATVEMDKDDNDLERFNRWFNDMEVRCYPSGNLPPADVLMQEYAKVHMAAKSANKQTGTLTPWQPIGPMTVPLNFDGIGRVNCIVVDPVNVQKLYVGTACGGIFISHDAGATWVSNSDQFPSLSIADIAVNPHHTDTIYAATGDGYGYVTGAYNIFWGGLYTAGVMKSGDGGSTWSATGLSYLQSGNDIIQRLLIHPNRTGTLLAATRNGILRTTDAGATWQNVEPGHVYSMAFRPGRPDTVYAVNNADLRVSYNAGATWQTLYSGISNGDRCTIAVTPAAPNAVYVLDDNEDLLISHNGGHTFVTVSSPSSVAHFYGYYDRVLKVSPNDSNKIIASGMVMARSTNGGNTWQSFQAANVHVDNHAGTFNPLDDQTFYCGSDGGIFATTNSGSSWSNLSNGLMISQMYRMAVSKQDPYSMLFGLQDNGTFSFNGLDWREVNGGDGMACAIAPADDNIQIASYQNGNYSLSIDHGNNFNPLNINVAGSWTSPVVFDPHSPDTIYFGLSDLYATYDQGSTFVNLTPGHAGLTDDITSLAIAPSNTHVIYVSDFGVVIRTTNGGATWTNVTGNLPPLDAKTSIAVDYNDPEKVYVTVSGYTTGSKVYMSTTGGTSWTNISYNLPNLPANCIAVDSTSPGALFVGTDMGCYYTDATQPGSWTVYSTGLPNVIVNDFSMDYAIHKVRVATYGRGAWECSLKKYATPESTPVLTNQNSPLVRVYPNPTVNTWRLEFANSTPAEYSIKVTDIAGRVVEQQSNNAIINAAGLSAGIYNIEVNIAGKQYSVKAIRK